MSLCRAHWRFSAVGEPENGRKRTSKTIVLLFITIFYSAERPRGVKSGHDSQRCESKGRQRSLTASRGRIKPPQSLTFDPNLEN